MYVKKIHQFLPSIKKMHTKENNWFLFSASRCSIRISVLLCENKKLITRLRLHMADPSTKSEVSSVSRCGDITWGVKF